MNKFLYENFPLCYARIYKAMLQHDGRMFIPEAIHLLSAGNTIDSLLGKNNSLSSDVYLGLHDIGYLEKKGYAHLMKPISTKTSSYHLAGELETILLQMIPSKRWDRYGVDEKNFDLILAVPKWSRIVSLSTTEIEPKDLVGKLHQFDTLILENYHFYEFFNKLHGVSGRNVKLASYTDQERGNNLSKLNFLFRSCDDAKMISNCGNMKLFTLIPDIGGKPRVGFFFGIIAKIKNARNVSRKDGTGFDPRNFMLGITDSSGSLDLRISTIRFASSIQKKYLGSEINQYLGHKCGNKHFGHPFDLMSEEVNVLMLCNWFLGDDFPNFSFGVVLDKKFDPSKFNEIAYMNTRKKVRYEKIKERFLSESDAFLRNNENVKCDSEKKWYYYKEDYWDENVFIMMIKNKFEIPSFHEKIQSNIEVEKFREWKNYATTYLQINDFVKILYVSEDPELDFNNVYATISQKSLNASKKFTPTNGEGMPVKNDWYWSNAFIPDLVSINKWSEVCKLIPSIKEIAHGGDEIFSWANGGRTLLTNWIDLRLRKSATSDEVTSALHYILQARGQIMIPVDAIN